MVHHQSWPQPDTIEQLKEVFARSEDGERPGHRITKSWTSWSSPYHGWNPFLVAPFLSGEETPDPLIFGSLFRRFKIPDMDFGWKFEFSLWSLAASDEDQEEISLVSLFVALLLSPLWSRELKISSSLSFLLRCSHILIFFSWAKVRWPTFL